MRKVGAGETERTLTLETKALTLAELFAALGAGRIAEDLEDDDVVGRCLLSRSGHTLWDDQLYDGLTPPLNLTCERPSQLARYVERPQ